MNRKGIFTLKRENLAGLSRAEILYLNAFLVQFVSAVCRQTA